MKKQILPIFDGFLGRYNIKYKTQIYLFSTVCFQMFSGERWSGGCDGMQGEQPAQLQGEHGQRSMNSVH